MTKYPGGTNSPYPSPFVDERQRLVARLRAFERGDKYVGRFAHILDTLGEAADQIERDGKLMQRLRFARPAGTTDPIWDELHNALASPSEGNKKEDTAERSFVTDDLLASRPQEQPRKATGEMVEAFIERFYSRRADREADLNQTVEASLNAALAVSVSPAAAEGWQMVPVAATKAMLRAMEDAESPAPPLRQGDGLDSARAEWAAVLAAAPPSPAV